MKIYLDISYQEITVWISNLLKIPDNDSILDNVYKLVHFGWKKEAIPITVKSKSLIAKFLRYYLTNCYFQKH